MQVTASAPGKLVLIGEYAVLFGHPALVMAVNRRARVDLRPNDGTGWRASAPGFCDDDTLFDLHRDRGFTWREPTSEAAARLTLVESVLGSLVGAGLLDPTDLRPTTVTLDTEDFFLPVDGGTAKLGLGSSAALTAALTEAVRNWVPRERRRAALGLVELLDLHRSFQGGRGSGIDLAASSLGGVVEYRLIGDVRTPDARPAGLPSGLVVVSVWTGRSASTSDFLARLEEKMRVDDGAIDAALGELGRISSDGIGHIRSRDLNGFLADVEDFVSAMETLGRAAGIPVLSKEHRTLRRLAEVAGVSYKPSGAGGGDVGLGFTDDPEAAAAFAARAKAEGFTPLDLQIDPEGVRVDRGHVG
jgi:phosphomevalonate kinase